MEKKEGEKVMEKNELNPTLSPAADAPQPAPGITAQAVVEQLRALNGQIADVAPLTPEQREFVRKRARSSNNVNVVQASISVIGAADLVSQAVGHDADQVRELFDERNRWADVENELRAMLNGISGANLIRRQRLAFIIDRAFGVGSQLALDPEHAGLVPHVQEIKRLRRLQRRRKPSPAAPAPQPNLVADASSETET
jgi:hypothetical protein